MKRTNDHFDNGFDNGFDIGDVSLPSPQYTEHDGDALFESPTKRTREPPQTHDLNTTIEDATLEFVTRRGVELRKFRSHGKPLVLVFFGVMRDHLEEINARHSTISKAFNADVLGASANLSSNDYRFPLVNGTLLTKKFNARDPVGGGVYPRDMMIFFDKFGTRRHEVLVRYNGRDTITKPISEVIKDVLEDMESEQMLR